MKSNSIGYLCPHCHTRELACRVTMPYIRGLVLAYMYGTKRFIGCVPCVRLKLLKEAGVSSLIGWFSITAFIPNALFIIYGVLRAIFLWANPEAVRKTLREAGLPEAA